jgi:hypothetical protein
MAMTNTKRNDSSSAWGTSRKVLFRIAFVFFAFLVLPLDWKYWRQLFSLHLSHYQDLFQLTAYSPQFISTPKWGIASYANWGLILIAALLGGLTWGFLDRKREEYDDLYYWLRVALRYRLAIGMIGYGMLMLAHLLFASPTLSDLNTNYGDFLPWKIYYLTMGAASAHYEQALGFIEIVGGILLLWRSTAVIGAALSAALLTNVVLASFAYQLGNHVYASSLMLIALFVVAHDLPRLFDLLFLERLAKADTYEPVFAAKRLRTSRVLLKSLVFLFIAVYGASAFASYRESNSPFPGTAGLKDAEGLYNVKEFSINGNELPYSIVDSVRWQNVVFEKWNTLSVHVNRQVTIDVAAPSIVYQPDEQRDYELAGNSGRNFYSYTADTANGKIYLRGKNDKNESLSFDYKYLDGGDILLTGNDQAGNVLRIVLEKVDKKYLLLVGRRHPISLY